MMLLLMMMMIVLSTADIAAADIVAAAADMLLLIMVMMTTVMMMMMKQWDDILSQIMGLKIFNIKVITKYGVQPQSSVPWCITWDIRPNYELWDSNNKGR